ncbi:MAG: endolytic transglycosylase MltG, partial [Bacteroidales bacterium]
FVPNTYYVFWNLSAEDLLKRMYKEQDKFWTTTRKEKAKKMGLNRIQVMTMASIVEQETEDKKEKADIASVYLNRLRKGMLLQADPTVKFAIGDFGLKRILQEHLQSTTPFNTYTYKGLPPGPICTPSSYSIDAVLQNKQTPYFYFCAKEDFSGTHAFAATYAQHQANAKAYHRALDQKAIK